MVESHGPLDGDVRQPLDVLRLLGLSVEVLEVDGLVPARQHVVAHVEAAHAAGDAGQVANLEEREVKTGMKYVPLKQRALSFSKYTIIPSKSCRLTVIIETCE